MGSGRGRLSRSSRGSRGRSSGSRGWHTRRRSWRRRGAPELGWRLARSAWGRGLATEAAAAARDDAFERLGLPELISIIHPENERSKRVAVKLGMRMRGEITNPVFGIDVGVWELVNDR